MLSTIPCRSKTHGSSTGCKTHRPILANPLRGQGCKDHRKSLERIVGWSPNDIGVPWGIVSNSDGLQHHTLRKNDGKIPRHQDAKLFSFWSPCVCLCVCLFVWVGFGFGFGLGWFGFGLVWFGLFVWLVGLCVCVCVCHMCRDSMVLATSSAKMADRVAPTTLRHSTPSRTSAPRSKPK